jgi:hypothetical protein
MSEPRLNILLPLNISLRKLFKTISMSLLKACRCYIINMVLIITILYITQDPASQLMERYNTGEEFMDNMLSTIKSDDSGDHWLIGMLDEVAKVHPCIGGNTSP